MSEKPNIILRKDIHKGKNIIRIEFPFNVQINDVLRKNTTAAWSKTLRCWFVWEDDFEMGHFLNLFGDYAVVDYSDLKKST